jgi:hypothetical protein
VSRDLMSRDLKLVNANIPTTTDVAVGGFARVRRVGFAISEGSMNFYISLLLADAIVLIINKNSS